MNKHKNEKDIQKKNSLLQTQRKTLEKLKSALASKLAVKDQISNYLSSIVRSRLINDSKPRYTNSYGFENWRQINIDLKKLEDTSREKFHLLM